MNFYLRMLMFGVPLIRVYGKKSQILKRLLPMQFVLLITPLRFCTPCWKMEQAMKYQMAKKRIWKRYVFQCYDIRHGIAKCCRCYFFQCFLFLTTFMYRIRCVLVCRWFLTTVNTQIHELLTCRSLNQLQSM